MARRPSLAGYVARRLTRPQVLAAAVFGLSGWLLHVRGKTRLAPLRQATDHSTFTAPYNLLVYAASKAPGGAYVPLDAVPDLAPLIESWRDIRDEGLALMRAGAITAATGHNDIGFHTFFKRGWTRFYLRWYGSSPPSALATCPRTCSLLASIPSLRGAMFAVLPAGAILGRHRDPFAGSLRLHLGLATPNDDACWIEVDGERYAWRDGEGVLFDETYVHEARNGTAEDRLILLCDIERPLRPPMDAINRWVMRNVMSATVTANVEGEEIGAINRAFGPIHAILQLGKPFKARNRKAYYAVKAGVGAALIAALVASVVL
jgi:beta-hydroxylase